MRKIKERHCKKCESSTRTLIVKEKPYCAKCGAFKPVEDKREGWLYAIAFFVLTVIAIAVIYSVLTFIQMVWN